MSPFTNLTLVVSGGSRGIGLAIALGAAKHDANVVLLAKTAEPHPKLPGTVHTAVADVEAAGGARAWQFDLMMDINVRGTFLLTKAALPHLRKSANAHVVTLAPPLNMNPYWLGAHPAYTLSSTG